MSIQKHRFLLLRLELCLCGWKYEYKAVIDFKKKNIGLSGCSFLFQIFFSFVTFPVSLTTSFRALVGCFSGAAEAPVLPSLTLRAAQSAAVTTLPLPLKASPFHFIHLQPRERLLLCRVFHRAPCILVFQGTLTWSCFCALCLNSLSKCPHTQPLLSCVTQSLHLILPALPTVARRILVTAEDARLLPFRIIRQVKCCSFRW